MRLEQLTGKQMDIYERRWTRVMIASGTALLAAIFGVCLFGSGEAGLVCVIVAAVSVVVGLIAAIKLRELERGSSGSDREECGDMHSALGALDD